MESYNRDMNHILKDLHPDLGITLEAKNNLSIILNLLLEKLVKQSISLLNPRNFKNPGPEGNKKTLTVKEITTSVRLIFPSMLRKYALNEGNKAVKRFETSDTIRNDTVRANLRLSVPKTRNIMDQYLPKGYHMDLLASVFATAVLEYILNELLELSGNNCQEDNKLRIKTEHIKEAVINDEELHSLLYGSLGISLPGV
jgi:histone H2B